MWLRKEHVHTFLRMRMTEKESPVKALPRGVLPCLHCGELIDMNGGDIHLCRAPKNAWLKKQKRVSIMVGDQVFVIKGDKDEKTMDD